MIGIVGSIPDSLRRALEETGAVLEFGSPDEVLEAAPDAIVADGRDSVAAILDSGFEADTPVLAVDASDGLQPIDDDAVADRLASGDPSTVSQPTLTLSVGQAMLGRAAFDAMLVASDPGEIGEYRITIGRERDCVRADGVVLATPAGSHDYALAAGGPRLETSRPIASVVPVGAFTMSPRRWVADLESTIRIDRQRSVPATLLLDGQPRSIPADGGIEVSAGPSIEFVDVEAS